MSAGRNIYATILATAIENGYPIFHGRGKFFGSPRETKQVFLRASKLKLVSGTVDIDNVYVHMLMCTYCWRRYIMSMWSD
ncbi:MAG: hypothetical protein ACHQWH_03740, partial [Nitrososphaerales archaeon]